MPASLLRRYAVIALLASATLGCGEADPAGPPPIPGLLIPGTWDMDEANNENLPTRISSRLISVVQEEVFLDSAQITIDENNAYVRRAWVRVFYAGTLDRSDVVTDEGFISVVSPGVFQFASTM